MTGFPEWDGFPLRDALARRLGVPVVVDKDTNAAALGLAVAGEGGSFAYLHLGTGLGAGLVLGGTVHRGARTGAGEFGHQVVQLDGPLCGCGNRGCIEALCLAAVARGESTRRRGCSATAAANLVALLDIDLVLLGGRTSRPPAESSYGGWAPSSTSAPGARSSPSLWRRAARTRWRKARRNSSSRHCSATTGAGAAARDWADEVHLREGPAVRGHGARSGTPGRGSVGESEI